MVIGYTLARLSAGANETSRDDRDVVLEHVDRIRAETGASHIARRLLPSPR